MSAASVQSVPASLHDQAECAWIATCIRHEARRRDQDGRAVNRIGRLTLESMDRCIEAGRIGPWQIATLVKHGNSGLRDDASPLERAEWHAAITRRTTCRRSEAFGLPRPTGRRWHRRSLRASTRVP